MIERPAINMVPFIDIMLVLLTIVLTTSTFIASGRIPVNLPQASRQPDAPQQTRTIAIDAAGRIYLQDKPTDLPGLKALTASLDRTTPVLVRADQSVRLQRFVEVADLLKQQGFTRVAIQTQAGGR